MEDQGQEQRIEPKRPLIGVLVAGAAVTGCVVAMGMGLMQSVVPTSKHAPKSQPAQAQSQSSDGVNLAIICDDSSGNRESEPFRIEPRSDGPTKGVVPCGAKVMLYYPFPTTGTDGQQYQSIVWRKEAGYIQHSGWVRVSSVKKAS